MISDLTTMEPEPVPQTKQKKPKAKAVMTYTGILYFILV